MKGTPKFYSVFFFLNNRYLLNPAGTLLAWSMSSVSMIVGIQYVGLVSMFVSMPFHPLLACSLESQYFNLGIFYQYICSLGRGVLFNKNSNMRVKYILFTVMLVSAVTFTNWAVYCWDSWTEAILLFWISSKSTRCYLVCWWAGKNNYLQLMSI